MLTLGAMSAYQRETGEEISQLRTDNMASVATLLYHCARSACRREKVDFPYDNFEEMADYILIEEMPQLVEGLFGKATADPDSDTKKKE